MGHVAPSLAVAEALRARGVEVTFAGSPDRVEARLVPERGYAFDAFRVAGFPRRPGPKLFGALGLAAAAPVACMRILARRQPDVVLGGGGYVAGPMVLAAWLRRIPAALTEADAHLGLANRLAAPFVQRLFLAYPIDGANGKARVVGAPDSHRTRGRSRRARRAVELGLPQDGPVVLVFGGSQGARTLNETAVDAWGDAGSRGAAPERRARLRRASRSRVARPDYRLLPFVDDFGAALAAADIVVVASRRLGVGDRSRRAACDSRSVSARDLESSAQERGVLRPRRAVRASSLDDRAHEIVPELVAELLADPERACAR